MIQNIKSIRKDRGFTIVELLVVIVVIGILAAITMVSYTGVTAKANTTKALSNAQSAATVAQVYYADSGTWPATAAAFATGYTGGSGATSKMPTGVTVVPGANGANGTTFTEPTQATLWRTNIQPANYGSTVTWACSPDCTAPTGGRITYWDFTTGAQSTNVIYVGSGAATGVAFETPES